MPLSTILQDAFWMLARRWRLMLVIFLILGGLSATIISMSPPRYAAHASLLVKYGREHTLRSYGSSDALIPANYAQDEIVSSAIEIMHSTSLTDAVVQSIGADRLYPQLMQISWLDRMKEQLLGGSTASGEPAVPPQVVAGQRVTKDVSFAPSGRSSVIGIQLTNGDPKVAADALNAFVGAFQKKYLSLYSENIVGLLETDLGAAQARLAEATDDVAQFERRKMAFAQDGQIDHLLERKASLDLEMSQVLSCCSDTTAAKELQRENGELTDRIVAMNADQATLRSLVRTSEAAQADVEQAARRLKDARTMEDLDARGVNGVEVVSPASPPLQTMRPGLKTRIAIALVLSLIAAASLGFIAEILVPRFSRPRELSAKFALPVLADVPCTVHG